jgi:hypothetical protein
MKPVKRKRQTRFKMSSFPQREIILDPREVFRPLYSGQNQVSSFIISIEQTI